MVDFITFEFPTNDYSTVTMYLNESKSYSFLASPHVVADVMPIDMSSVMYRDGTLNIMCGSQYASYQDVLLQNVNTDLDGKLVKVKLQVENKNKIVDTAKACKFKVS